MRLCFLKHDSVFLFGCPIHPNLGDQAQRMCISKWIQKNFPTHNLIEINHTASGPWLFKIIEKKIKPTDVILFHSGYLMTDHHSELPALRQVVRRFRNHRILILPQTILLRDSELRKSISREFNNHPDIVLLCRDETSHHTASVLFKKATLLLYPDIVTTMIGTLQFNSIKKGVLFCMRNDIEAHYKSSQI